MLKKIPKFIWFILLGLLLSVIYIFAKNFWQNYNKPFTTPGVPELIFDPNSTTTPKIKRGVTTSTIKYDQKNK